MYPKDLQKTFYLHPNPWPWGNGGLYATGTHIIQLIPVISVPVLNLILGFKSSHSRFVDPTEDSGIISVLVQAASIRHGPGN